ncbi:MAG TPA: hypothetical protein DHV64_11000 [Erythrobacter sp.]|nr:hypothetical protein [Erythrobacter sp.]
MLEGNPASLLEALLLFGVQNPNAELTRMRKDGLRIESKRVPMAKIIVRINKFVQCSVPDDLPYRELTMTEYWIAR